MASQNKGSPGEGNAGAVSSSITTAPQNTKTTEESKAAFEITEFSKHGGPLTKRISINKDGLLKCDGSACIMARGTARRVRLANAKQLAELIERLKPFQAIALGAMRDGLPDQVNIVTKAKLKSQQADTIARSSDAIGYREGKPAFVLLDSDSKGMPDHVAARLGGFLPALHSVIPALATTAHVTRRSTSSGLSRSDTKEKLPGSENLHCYVAVRDGGDVERFLKTLHERCWLAGLGWKMVGKGGQLLERSIVDRMVFGGERLVFEGGPILLKPLQQDRESRLPVAVDGNLLDTLAACPNLTDAEIAQVRELKTKEDHRLAPETAKARTAFVKEQVERIVKRNPETSLHDAEQMAKRYIKGVLLSDVELPFVDAKLAGKTVADVLADPDFYFGKKLADPLEGVEYDADCAIIMRDDDGRPFIHSFAHGKTVYKLKYAATAVRKVIEQADKEVVATAFITMALAADLTKRQEKDLIERTAERGGIKAATVAAMLEDAILNGQLRFIEPTYPAETYSDIAAARDTTQEIMEYFLKYDVACPADESDPFIENVQVVMPAWREDYNKFLRALKLPPEEDFPQVTKAVRITTGVGKTKIVIAKIAEWLPKVKVGPIIYAVPRHKLGENIKKQFAAHGVDARIFRGRKADDPENPGQQMCLNLTAVDLALKCHADVSATCCKQGKLLCKFFEQCGYQRQKGKPAVWIVAGDTLFHSQKALGDPAAVIIDEAIWNKGLRGVEDKNDRPIAIDSLLSSSPENLGGDEDGQRNFNRHCLGEMLAKQPNDGACERQYFNGLTAKDCAESMKVEWAYHNRLKEEIGIVPGMPEAKIKKLANDNRIDAIHHTRRIIRIWSALRGLINSPEIEKSGHLTIKTRDGQRCVAWRGVAEIKKQFEVPTLLLDATLPDLSILRAFHPLPEVIADIEVKMPPHVHIKQILHAPSSSTKLDNEKHLNEMRRYILRRWRELGQCRTLVICQEKVEEWLKKSKLPKDIEIEHYKDVAGIDHFKDVRLLILIGRTAPPARTIEAQAAALSGAQPQEIPADKNGFAWFHKVTHGIRLPDGRGIEIDKADLHPDPMAEAVRWQIHEAELIQALGRARGINRTAETPLDADLLFDTCLPITVDVVSNWKPPSLLMDTALDGVMLTSQSDMVKLWPTIWPDRKAAQRTLQQGVPKLPGFEPITYQLVGPKMNQRIAYFDRGLIPNPQAWLEQRLGPLKNLP